MKNKAGAEDDDASPTMKKAKTAKKPSPDKIGRDETSPLEIASSEDFIKIISWNVAGLRGLLKNDSECLKNLVVKHDPDILCLCPENILENCRLITDE